jgi:transposase
VTRALAVEQREKIVKAYEKGLGTGKEIAEMFGVTPRSVFRYLKLSRENGDLSPEPIPGRPPILSEENLEILKKIIIRRPDSTLEQYKCEFYEQTGIEVTIVTIHNGCNILNLNRKKKFFRIGARESGCKNKTRMLYCCNDRY